VAFQAVTDLVPRVLGLKNLKRTSVSSIVNYIENLTKLLGKDGREFIIWLAVELGSVSSSDADAEAERGERAKKEFTLEICLNIDTLLFHISCHLCVLICIVTVDSLCEFGVFYKLLLLHRRLFVVPLQYMYCS